MIGEKKEKVAFGGDENWEGGFYILLFFLRCDSTF